MEDAPNDKHQHDFEEADLDVVGQASLVLRVDSLSALEQRRDCGEKSKNIEFILFFFPTLRMSTEPFFVNRTHLLRWCG